MPNLVQRVVIEAKIEWQVGRATSGNWIGVCQPLRLTLQSDTWASLMEDIGLALDGLLREMMKSNELETFLREHGWKPIGALPSRHERVRFDVPFIPVKVAQHGFQNCLH